MGGGYKNKVTPNKNKTLKVAVLTAIISVLLTSGICVVAVNLTAKDIGFISTNEEWEVNNVNDAINDLYKVGMENSSHQKILIKSGLSSATSNVVDVSSYEGYENFTSDQFMFTNIRLTYTGRLTENPSTIVCKYDASTGKATFSSSSSNSGDWGFYIIYDVYLII